VRNITVFVRGSMFAAAAAAAAVGASLYRDFSHASHSTIHIAGLVRTAYARGEYTRKPCREHAVRLFVQNA
jgi:precorrin-3B methylase